MKYDRDSHFNHKWLRKNRSIWKKRTFCGVSLAPTVVNTPVVLVRLLTGHCTTSCQSVLLESIFLPHRLLFPCSRLQHHTEKKKQSKQGCDGFDLGFCGHKDCSEYLSRLELNLNLWFLLLFLSLYHGKRPLAESYLTNYYKTESVIETIWNYNSISVAFPLL